MNAINATESPNTTAAQATGLGLMERPVLELAVKGALERIPPLWPLKHFVAVNPFMGFSGRRFEEACVLLEAVHGSAPVMKADEYREAFVDGVIKRKHLETVADEVWTTDRLLKFLISDEAEAGEEGQPAILTVADALDRTRAHSHWGEFIANEVSRWCAVTLDENQTIWTSPWRASGLFGGWLEYARLDRNPETFGLRGFRDYVRTLPSDPYSSLSQCLSGLTVPPAGVENFLHRQLASVSGWAGYIQYLVREARMQGRENPMLLELLAIRLAYDAALHSSHGPELDGLTIAPATRSEDAVERLKALSKWQHAYELGFQQDLVTRLCGKPKFAKPARPDFQAIFCIDVRSEIFRRHLEAAAPGGQTVGFAGFFGMPVAHRAADAAVAVPRCPVLLVPPVTSVEAAPVDDATKLRRKAETRRAWKGFQNSAASCFSFVETFGLGYAAKLRLHEPASKGCGAGLPPILDADTPDAAVTRVNLAAGALKNMGLTDGFARLVLVCGHGSRSANNPYASALDCGACGGHAGDVNARLAVGILNDPSVRVALRQRGVGIPDDTVFLAAMHNTATDEVALFDADGVPATHQRDLASLRLALEQAGKDTRAERAASLGYDETDAEKLAGLIHGRAVDISQVRPEWALAKNAAFVAAPRRRTADLQLGGRVFLHDYDAENDPDHSILTLILTAPVVVASWINLQYYGSRVNPRQYSSGNKTLHNVAGGIGVFEGNGGDLRPGLPWQSIHDGKRYIHEPRRLSVFIEADPGVISAILDAHPAIRDLFTNEWLHLFAIGNGPCLRYRGPESGWHRFAGSA